MNFPSHEQKSHNSLQCALIRIGLKGFTAYSLAESQIHSTILNMLMQHTVFLVVTTSSAQSINKFKLKMMRKYKLKSVKTMTGQIEMMMKHCIN